jgi:hypothetical protein
MQEIALEVSILSLGLKCLRATSHDQTRDLNGQEHQSPAARQALAVAATPNERTEAAMTHTADGDLQDASTLPGSEGEDKAVRLRPQGGIYSAWGVNPRLRWSPRLAFECRLLAWG